MQAPTAREVRPGWRADDVYVRQVNRMSLHAWEPYIFAVSLLFNFQHVECDEDHPEWRIYWFSGVVVLRSIGHVLHRVDSQVSARHRLIIDKFWTDINSSKDENWIFFDFIDRERNNILKEFSFGAQLPSEEDGRILSYNGTHHDGAELFSEAVYWWRAQLEFIEEELSRT